MSEFHQIEHQKVQEAYSNNSNYKIISNREIKKNKKPKACIYFSSNGIYFPNTIETFENFLEKDKYEWESNKLIDIDKHIFVRDIYKQWYANGINSKLNSIDKLIDFLKLETNGYQLVTIGVSSGGYMAMLVGRILEAEKIICFNGQFDIWDQSVEPLNLEKNPLLIEVKNNKAKNKYFNILDACFKSNSSIFYFGSTLSDWDKEQSEIGLKLNDFHPVFIKNDMHGVPFYMQNLSTVLNMTASELKRISSHKEISKFRFSIKVNGFKESIRFFNNTKPNSPYFYILNKVYSLLNKMDILIYGK